MNKYFWVLLFFWGSINPLFAQEIFQAHTHVKLVSEQNAVVPGKTFWVGVDFKLDDGWHIYWQNPGDSGLAPKIKWDLPSGIKAGNFQWPYPGRINVGPLTSFGYEQEVFLLIPVSVDRDLKASTVDLHAKLSWLACQEECIPGHGELNLSLPVVADDSGITYNDFKSPFDHTRLNLPQALSYISSKAIYDGHQWRLDIQTSVKNQGDILFYPFRDDVIEHPVAQISHATDEGYEIFLTKSHIYQANLDKLEGIAVNPQGWDVEGKIKAVDIQAPIENGVIPVQISVALACLFAFIGGLILNLMPCVLPVLSIKVLHLIERHPDRKTALHHSLAYASGILVSLWALGFLLYLLKTAGKFAGWGFQFQSPIFVIFVAVVLFVLALNLFGVFEFSMPAIGGLPKSQVSLQASFMSGIITTIVASPCTAPFMGTALALALGQPGIVGCGIFTFLGLGLALPFVLLSAFPSLLSFVPKPGLWMIQLKRLLGVILIGCVIWLLWVFGLQTGLGDLSKFYKPAYEIQWQKYSPGAVTQARHTGRPVFIDFTAAWCINCQVNDRLVLQNLEVVNVFRKRGIIAFKADWTKYDPQITKSLSLYGRESIPVYIYYPPGSSTADILPQVITRKSILDKIK